MEVNVVYDNKYNIHNIVYACYALPGDNATAMPILHAKQLHNISAHLLNPCSGTPIAVVWF